MNFKIAALIISTVYALAGVLYLNWDVFYLVYLFWFENFIRIISYKFKSNAVSYTLVNNQIVPARNANGVLINELRIPFTTRLFFYSIYFVFIIVGGFILPFLLSDTDSTLNGLVAFVSILTFKHFDFNIALLLCVINELVIYYRDFKTRKIYTQENPFIAPGVLEKEDIVLHLSIILTAVFAFLSNHPSIKIMNISNITYIPGIILILLRFVAQLYSIKKGEENGGDEIGLRREQESVINDLNKN